ncbi:MAG TPA: hypothetical protein VKA68_11870 [bacterium]|nr:hypothetical protein [bacterium]
MRINHLYRTLFSGFKALYRGTVAENEDQLKAAQTQIHKLRIELQDNGIPLHDSIEELPARLNRRYKAGGSEPGLKESVEQFQQKREELTKVVSRLSSFLEFRRKKEQNNSSG